MGWGHASSSLAQACCKRDVGFSAAARHGAVPAVHRCGGGGQPGARLSAQSLWLEAADGHALLAVFQAERLRPAARIAS